MEETVFSMVPGQAPVRLAAYYKSFKDYYFDCELQTKRWAVENVNDDWVICDIGANVGVYSCLFGRLANRGRVYSFEPTDTFVMLQTNVAANSLFNVECLRLAVGSKSGKKDEKIYRIWGAEPERGDYDFTTFDEFVESRGLTRLDCVKIDVDGFDLEVLRGAERSLRRFNPWIIIELNHALATRGQSVSDALLWLQAQGYGSAFAMDKENFLLRRDPAQTSSGGISISFDRDPVLLEPMFGPGQDLGNIFDTTPQLHNGADAGLSSPPLISCSAARWSYLASWQKNTDTGGEAIIEIDADVQVGTIGFGAISPDWTTYASREVELGSGPGVQTARISVEDLSRVEGIMARGNSPESEHTRFAVRGIRVSRPAPLPSRNPPVMRSAMRSFDLESCLPGGDPVRQKRIDIVPVSELDRAIGAGEIYAPPRLVYPYGLADFKTEIDEPEIYRFIYRNFAPRRHLEFGTWEGFGAALCASACEAEIWTIDMPTGELDAQGNPVYGERHIPGDESRTGDHRGIGWRYRAAGFGSRVHQIFSDSREVDLSEFGAGFFDSVLVDGGHTADVVINDTLKALPLLRSGGLMIWHDFCPDPDVVARSEAGRGVVEGLRRSYDQWSDAFTQVFWVRPSWLLVGVKK